MGGTEFGGKLRAKYGRFAYQFSTGKLTEDSDDDQE